MKMKMKRIKFRLYKIKTSFDKKEVIYTNDEVLSDKK